MKQVTKIAISILAAIFTASLSLAADPTPPAALGDITRKQAMEQLSQELAQLNQHMTNLQQSAIENRASEEYQSLFGIQSLLSDDFQSIENQATQQTRIQTQQEISYLLCDIRKQLLPIPVDHSKNNSQCDIPKYLLPLSTPSKPITDSGINSSDTPANDLMTALTLNMPASDTLQTENNALNQNAINNSVFNFNTLFSPSTYSPAEQLQAQQYKALLFSLYKPPIDVKGLLTNLDKKSLTKLLTSPEYKTFQANFRANVAVRSLLLSNLNMLIAERTPLKSNGLSLLQLERLRADQTQNKSWQKKIKSASTGAIQREQLQILADIRQELQRNREINERLLATMTIATTFALQGVTAALEIDKNAIKTKVNEQVTNDSDEKKETNSRIYL